MKNNDPLGQFEQLVLTAVLLLGEEAYGMAVHAKAGEFAGRTVKISAVYTTLDRLEEKGYLTSAFEHRTGERTGKAKRFFRLLAAGEKALQESRSIAMRLHEAVDDDSWRFKWRPKPNPAR